MTTATRLLATTLLSTALCLAGLAGCDREGAAVQGKAKKPPVPAVVVKAAEADVPVELRALGAVEPVQSTPIRSQIGGTITELKVREGGLVTAGQVLFQIDPGPYEATLRQLRANLARDEAQARNAEAQVRNAEAQVQNTEAQASLAESQAKRYEELVQKDYVTKEQYDQRRTAVVTARAAILASRAAVDAARAQVDSARASADSTRAAIENARLQLGYTAIRAPVSGQVGSLQLKQGDLVKANDVPLVVVNQLQPILVRFTVPEPSLPEVRARWKAGTVRVRVTPAGSAAPREGQLIFVDNAVDTSTGTIVLKARFDNRDTLLWPGQLLDVTVVLYTRQKAVVVPSEAVQTGQKGPYVFVVTAEGTAEVRPVKPGVAAAGRVVIDEGLRAGETVVTDGQLRLTPGAKVSPRDGLESPGAGPGAGKNGEGKGGGRPEGARPGKGAGA
ncbi:MAG: efflux RND transporter periplasmic adaptor subunit [Deltaproteobacteria bacterium]|nr:efflux RND transporter periplasmic adaptor subunit [Deltaproteobacteria bacterium]